MRATVSLLTALCAAAIFGFAAAAAAAPVRYLLEQEKSIVGFETDFGPDLITGEMPVAAADLLIDLAQPANSRVSVTLDVAGARASFLFATQALQGPKVLATRDYPEIRFVSTRVRRDGDGALIDGVITIRGHDEPITFVAEFFTQFGYERGDLSHLSIVLTGAVQRSRFGATGWADMVGDEVRLKITARIARAGG